MTKSDNQLATVMQYTIEAYKIFQKLAELLPNPMAAAVFNNFAEDERANRDLLEIKYLDPAVSRIKIGLGSDLGIQDALEGNLSHRELTEVLITRELTMAHWLRSAALDCRDIDRNLFNYLAFCKQAHIVYLEREMQLLGIYEDWYKREDAESLIVAGRSMV